MHGLLTWTHSMRQADEQEKKKLCIEFEQRCINRSLATHIFKLCQWKRRVRKRKYECEKHGMNELNDTNIKVSINFWLYLHSMHFQHEFSIWITFFSLHIEIKIGLIKIVASSDHWQFDHLFLHLKGFPTPVECTEHNIT